MRTMFAQIVAMTRQGCDALRCRQELQFLGPSYLAFIAAVPLTLLIFIVFAIASQGEADDVTADDTAISASGASIIGPEGYRWTVQTASKPYSLTIKDAIYRFEIRPNDRWSGDGARSRHTRSEISGLQVPSRGRSTIAYDVMILKGDFSALGVQHVIGQRHGKADFTDRRGEHPTLAFRILSGGRPSLTVSGSPEQPLRLIPKSRYPWTGRPEDFRRGVWHRIKIDAYAGRKGWVDLWLDERLMRQRPADRHTYVGAFGYVNLRDDYWKFGDYCARGASNSVVVQIKNIQRTGP